MSMKNGFSTLACPAWTLDRVLDTAVELGFDGIELRFIESDDRLWQRPEFTGSGLRQTRQRLRDAGMPVCCVDTSCFFHHPEGGLRQASLEMGRGMIELAAELGAPGIRVFGDRVQPGADRAETVKWIAEGVRTLASHGGPYGVETWLETHGDFARAADTKEILQAAGAENTGAIWDPLNSYSEFGEDPAAGLAVWLGNLRRVDNPPEPPANRPAGAGCQPARRIPSCPTTNGIVLPGLRHAHIKDARQAGSLWEPVLMGTGDFPAARVVDLLRQHDYRGFVSFEWEKRWHAQIPEPEVALPHFMQWMRAALEA